MAASPVEPSPDASIAPASILSRLKLETRPGHEAVEQALDLMCASLTREGYERRLQQFFGFYAPLEKALGGRLEERATTGEASSLSLAPAVRSALALRLDKTARLRHDLRGLGVKPEDLRLCRDLPPLTTQAEVLGCLYVIEGATLGGRMIGRHIEATLGITAAAAGSFFGGYGADTGSMWQGMRQLLLGAATDRPTENAIVANAITTFNCLRGWCEAMGNHTETRTSRHA